MCSHSSFFNYLDQPRKERFSLCHWVSLCLPISWKTDTHVLPVGGRRPLCTWADQQPEGCRCLSQGSPGHCSFLQAHPCADIQPWVRSSTQLEQKEDLGREGRGNTGGVERGCQRLPLSLHPSLFIHRLSLHSPKGQGHQNLVPF